MVINIVHFQKEQEDSPGTTCWVLVTLTFDLHEWNFQSAFLLINPLPDDKISDLSKFKQIAEDILKCIQNGKQVPYRVENIVRNGEIACYKQFLLFSRFP